MTTAQQFDRTMWDTFSGCEQWLHAGRHQPVSREVGDTWLVIADPQGVTATTCTNEQWVMDVAFPTQTAAIAFLNGLPATFEPEYFGFTRLA